jgi:histidine triad (HIT) family protein
MTRECKFCRIARRELSAQVVADTAGTLAFLPLRPVTIGHTLVIPKTHVPDLWAAAPQLAASVTNEAIRVGRAIAAALHPDGMNLITSAGAAASQTELHLHLHVVPRWLGDHLGHIWPQGEAWLEAEQVREDMAAIIADACAAIPEPVFVPVSESHR